MILKLYWNKTPYYGFSLFMIFLSIYILHRGHFYLALQPLILKFAKNSINWKSYVIFKKNFAGVLFPGIIWGRKAWFSKSLCRVGFFYGWL